MSAESPLLVTVFSDASVRDGKAGFGWWFKSSTASGSGIGIDDRNFGGHIEHAELVGILIAVKEAIRAHPDTDLSFVIQCDNLSALGAIASIGGRSAKKSPIFIKSRPVKRLEELSDLNLLAQLFGTSLVYLKHVRGHQGNRCARSSVNSLTDRLSREARTKSPSVHG